MFGVGPKVGFSERPAGQMHCGIAHGNHGCHKIVSAAQSHQDFLKLSIFPLRHFDLDAVCCCNWKFPPLWGLSVLSEINLT